MESNNSKPVTYKRTLGPFGWFLQALSGLFLVAFVGVHLYIAHINFGHPIAFFRDVLINMHSPLWLLFYISFVWIVTYHGLNGVKGVLYDMGLKDRTRKIVAVGLTILYFATVAYGTILALIVAGMPIPAA